MAPAPYFHLHPIIAGLNWCEFALSMNILPYHVYTTLPGFLFRRGIQIGNCNFDHQLLRCFVQKYHRELQNCTYTFNDGVKYRDCTVTCTARSVQDQLSICEYLFIFIFSSISNISVDEDLPLSFDEMYVLNFFIFNCHSSSFLVHTSFAVRTLVQICVISYS